VAGQRVGYIRVSSLDQHTDRQLDGIELDRVFTDTASGKDVSRPQLDALLGFVRDGDTVIVHSMDRLCAAPSMPAGTCATKTIAARSDASSTRANPCTPCAVTCTSPGSGR
jgi:predicted site-specific integrase-resolvase